MFLWQDFRIKVRGSCNPSLPVQCSGPLISDDINHLTLLKENTKNSYENQFGFVAGTIGHPITPLGFAARGLHSTHRSKAGDIFVTD